VLLRRAVGYLFIGAIGCVAAPPQEADEVAVTHNVAAPKTPGFWKRFASAYWRDWHPSTAEASPTPPPAQEPAFRGYPPPVQNPPFPFSVWPIGGTPWIGYPNATNYPLTQALLSGPHGEWWKNANIQIYGWVDVGGNLSTSHARPFGNLPAAYSEIPNAVQLDQLTLYVERVPDTIQTDHWDWGFRFTNLYGLDYRFTTAEGYFSQQLLNDPKSNGSIGNKYGYDPVMATSTSTIPTSHRAWISASAAISLCPISKRNLRRITTPTVTH
jgi:hypothetical protein